GTGPHTDTNGTGTGPHTDTNGTGTGTRPTAPTQPTDMTQPTVVLPTGPIRPPRIDRPAVPPPTVVLPQPPAVLPRTGPNDLAWIVLIGTFLMASGLLILFADRMHASAPSYGSFIDRFSASDSSRGPPVSDPDDRERAPPDRGA
ncbi:MAG: LPXTG cell wall anchor domain-containing protein, partial [Actinomycetota bacterium]